MSSERRVNFIFYLAIASVIVMVMLIWMGIFDSQPIGELKEEWRVGTLSGARWLGSAAEAYSVQVVMDSAESPAALLIGTPDNHIAIAADPVGYLAIWQQVDDERTLLRPWQTWVHVERQQNEIWLDAEGDRWTIRVNREVYYEGVALFGAGQVGVWGENSAEISSFKLYRDNKKPSASN